MLQDRQEGMRLQAENIKELMRLEQEEQRLTDEILQIQVQREK